MSLEGVLISEIPENRLIPSERQQVASIRAKFERFHTLGVRCDGIRFDSTEQSRRGCPVAAEMGRLEKKLPCRRGDNSLCGLGDGTALGRIAC